MLAHTAALTGVINVPLNVDTERCYAEDLAGVTKTVRLLGDAGAAGCSIEDYDPVTKTIDPIGLATERVAAAAEGAKASGLLLTARAENPFYGYDDLDDTIARLCAYRDAGADVMYAPGLTNPDHIARVVAETGAPVNVLARSNGPTVNSLGELGVRRISTGGAIARASFELLHKAARELLDQGTSTYTVGTLTADDYKKAFG
jgi:2-methylisocitrate lyase-like PEP mutase family enzyme